jgi:type IV pilus assembly protein PilM
MRAGLRSRPWAGIDVGSFSVKVLAAQAGVGGHRYWAAEVPFPAADADPERPPGTDTIARAVSECLAKAGFSPRSFRGISLGIGGPDVIVKQLSLPLLDDSEVGPALRFEARKHLPFDPQGMILDFQIVGRYPTERKLDILLAAVSQEHAERHMAPLRLLGMEPDILDAAPLALTNAVVQGSDAQSPAHVLLDIGNAASHLTLYQRGEPFFSRRLEFGGRNLSRAIAQGTQVPFEEAEEWKLAAGADQPGFRVDWESREMRAVSDCLRHDLVDELRRSFAFYRTQGHLPDPLRLWLSGGAARLPGLGARLSEMLGSPVLLFDPLQSREAPPGGAQHAGGPQFAQAFGLAMRTA